MVTVPALCRIQHYPEKKKELLSLYVVVQMLYGNGKGVKHKSFCCKCG